MVGKVRGMQGGGAPIEATLIVAMGLPGSGKTSLASALANHLALVHISSDVVRKELTGTPLTQHPLTEKDRRDLYSPAITRRTYAAMRRRAARSLRQGHSVVLDATYGNPIERAAVVRLAERLGTPLVVLVCEADEATIAARLAARAGDPETVSDARLDLWPALRAAYTEPIDLPHAIHLDMTQPMPAIIARVIDTLATRRNVPWEN
jgi:predicted kinase